MHPLADADPQ